MMNKTPFEEEADREIAAMKRTAGARFEAAARCSFQDKLFTWLTALSSAFIIGLTALPFIWRLQTNVANDLAFATLVFSVLVLVSSLLQYAGSMALEAEQLHRSALEINEVRRELQIAKLEQNFNGENLKTLIQKYGAVLQKFSVNHSERDGFRFQGSHPTDYPETLNANWPGKSKALICTNLSYLIFTFIIIALLSFSGLVYYSWIHRADLPSENHENAGK